MVRKGFKMFLYPGMAEEYEKRHNALWPEMKEMIHEYQADGVVEKISLLDGKFVIYVDGEAFSMDEIMEIKDKPAAEGSGENNETPPDETPPDGTPPDKTPPDK